MTELSGLSRSERQTLAKVLAPVGFELGNPNTRQQAVLQGIKLLVKATEQRRYEWVYWYTLGDFCQEAGNFLDKSLRACSCAYHLRPDDPRSVYALATAFRQLSYARFLEKPGASEGLKRLRSAGYQAPWPEASKAALDRLGITVDEAASAAIHFFTNALTMVKGKDKDVIHSHLTALRNQFPELTPEAIQVHLAPPLRYVQEHVGRLGTTFGPPISVPKLPSYVQHCQKCGSVRPVYHIKLDSNIGLLVIRFRRSVEGNLCWPCIQDEYRSHSVTNWLLGWWGIISFFATIGYLSANSASYYKAKQFFEGLEQRGL
jgi:hypothetical protein